MKPKVFSQDKIIIHLYLLETMKNSLGALVNLLTLILGITIGIVMAPRYEKHASANEIEPQPSSVQTPTTGSTGAGIPSPRVISVTPTMSAGTIGAYVLLAHHVQSDELVVNGYDILKLHNAELSMLSRLIPASDMKRLIDESKAQEVLTIVQPTQPVPTVPIGK